MFYNRKVTDYINTGNELTIITGCAKNESVFESHGTPNDGGRFFNLLLKNKSYDNHCICCKKTKQHKFKTHKIYTNHECDSVKENIYAFVDGTMFEWNSEDNQFDVTCSKF